MSETQQQQANGETFWSIFFSKAKTFLLSEKTWIFILSQFGAMAILWFAPKVGLTPDQVTQIIFGLLAKLGVESVGLTMAKAKIDADVSAAKVHGDAIRDAARSGSSDGSGQAEQLAAALKQIEELKAAKPTTPTVVPGDPR